MRPNDDIVVNEVITMVLYLHIDAIDRVKEEMKMAAGQSRDNKWCMVAVNMDFYPLSKQHNPIVHLPELHPMLCCQVVTRFEKDMLKHIVYPLTTSQLCFEINECEYDALCATYVTTRPQKFSLLLFIANEIQWIIDLSSLNIGQQETVWSTSKTWWY